VRPGKGLKERSSKDVFSATLLWQALVESTMMIDQLKGPNLQTPPGFRIVAGYGQFGQPHGLQWTAPGLALV
jgi:hypothetical protein